MTSAPLGMINLKRFAESGKSRLMFFNVIVALTLLLPALVE